MASVRKRTWEHAGVTREAWVVEYTDRAGKRRRKTFQRKKDADEGRLKIEREIAGGYHVADRKTLTFNVAAELWVEDRHRRVQLKELARSTVYKTDYLLEKHLRPKLGTMLLTSVTSDVIERLLIDNAGKVAKGTNRGVLTVASMILAFAVKRKLIVRSTLIDEPVAVPGIDLGKSRMPDKEAIRAMLASLTHRRKDERVMSHRNRVAVILLALFCGLRKGEIAGLQWENIDFQNGVIRIRHSYSTHDGLKAPKTASSVRDVPMPDAVRYALLGIIDYWQTRERVFDPSRPRATNWTNALKDFAGRDDRWDWFDPTPLGLTGYVMLNQCRQPIRSTGMGKVYFYPTVRAAGLWPAGSKRCPYTMHGLRHAAVSLLIDSGLSAMHVQKMVGHKKVSTTLDVYGHLFPDDDRTRKAIDHVSTAFSAGLLPAPTAG